MRALAATVEPLTVHMPVAPVFEVLGLAVAPVAEIAAAADPVPADATPAVPAPVVTKARPAHRKRFLARLFARAA